MAARSDAGEMEKVFEHCQITWRIENYILATFGENWIIDSPKIYVREPRTKWKMSLTPNPQNDKSMFFQLERLEYDTGPYSVCVDWKMALVTMKGETEVEHLILVGENSFGNNEYHKECLNRDTIEECIVPLLDDKNNFYIRFQLIISHENADKTLAQFDSDDDMKNLQDFIKMHEGGKYDIEIINKLHKIKAHKEVLTSCSRYFENHIKRDTSYITLDLDCVELTKIIAYLYSRDLKYVLSKPTLVLYDIIKKLKIKELELYYSLSLIRVVELNTAQNVQYDEFRWVIENVSSRTHGTIIRSPIIYDDSFKTCWKLVLQIKLEKNSMRMSISAESLEPDIEDTSNTRNEEADMRSEEADMRSEESDMRSEESDMRNEEADMRIEEAFIQEVDMNLEEADTSNEDTSNEETDTNNEDTSNEEADTSNEDTSNEEADTSNEEAESHRIPTFIELIPMTSEGSYFPMRTRKTGFIQANVIFKIDDFFEIEKSEMSSLPGDTLHIIFKIQMLLSRTVSKRKNRKIFLQ